MELTKAQIERQDFVDNSINDLLQILIPNNKNLDWDINCIAQVRDAICQVFVDKDICKEQEFYPQI